MKLNPDFRSKMKAIIYLRCSLKIFFDEAFSESVLPIINRVIEDRYEIEMRKEFLKHLKIKSF